MHEERRRRWEWVVLGLILEGSAMPALEQHCAGCHRGTEATGNLAQGIRNLADVPCDAAARFAGEHYEMMTGDLLPEAQARSIHDEICAWDPGRPPQARGRKLPGT